MYYNYPVFTYDIKSKYPVKDIFNSKKFTDKHDAYINIISPALYYYQSKYINDDKITEIIELADTYDELEYPVYVVSDKIYIKIIKFKQRYKIFMMIKSDIVDSKCICDLIYYYTYRHFIDKKNKIYSCDLDLLPLHRCNYMNEQNITHIENWMRYMDIPL